jgi:transmembrane sensor
VTLSDGTKLNINSASKVKYYSDYNIEERKVALDGEAYFDVKHDKTKPFTVTCGDISITVLGTTFGIKDYSYDSYISVVLRTGKILLQTPTEKINMHPNEKVVYNKITGKTETSEVEADDYVNWMNDQLRFDNETLGNIVRAISNMHNVNIVFADNKLKDMHYTGTLNSKTVDDALNMITQTSPIRYKQKDGKIILYHK